MDYKYPEGSIVALLNTDLVTDITKKVLIERGQEKDYQPLFFTLPDFECLTIVCDCLMAQNSNNRMVTMAHAIDTRLNCKTGNGWRYNNMPSDDEMYREGLKGINKTANLLYNKKFIDLPKNHQLKVLGAVQKGLGDGFEWDQLQQQQFFEEMLAEVTEVFFSHPLVQDEMGYAGMADAKGWEKIRLNEREEREPIGIKIETRN